MPQYGNGKVYAIRSHLTTKVYVGSTTATLAKRIYDHRRSFKGWLNYRSRVYTSSYEILKYGDEYIELLEDCPCDNKAQLNRREGELIRATEHCVNKVIPGRTKAECLEDAASAGDQTHRDKLEDHRRVKENIRAYCAANRETEKSPREKELEKRLAEQLAKRYSCACGGRWSSGYKSQHMTTNLHREYLVAMARRNARTTLCACGGRWSGSGKNRHAKSLRHQRYLATTVG